MIECPHCGKEQSKVLSTYRTDKGHYERLRKCHDCGKQFTTREYTSNNLKRLISDAFDSLSKKFGGR